MKIAIITRAIPIISTQFKWRWKKITDRIEVVIGCIASMIDTTSDGANRVASINNPNGKIVPNKTTVATEATRTQLMCGGLIQNGR